MLKSRATGSIIEFETEKEKRCSVMCV